MLACVIESHVMGESKNVSSKSRHLKLRGLPSQANMLPENENNAARDFFLALDTECQGQAPHAAATKRDSDSRQGEVKTSRDDFLPAPRFLGSSPLIWGLQFQSCLRLDICKSEWVLSEHPPVWAGEGCISPAAPSLD